jgi:hypothetical protein
MTYSLTLKSLYKTVAILCIGTMFSFSVLGQRFIHPGINQTADDLTYMKKQVQKGEQPWKGAFERLKAKTDLKFEVKAHAHVLRGPYGKPDIGGSDLSKGAEMAYNCALMWFLTGDKAYAAKSIEIINAWSPVIWDLDYNDAKLLAAWTGHIWCNAAEILRYTDSGWQKNDIERFSNMLMTVYYPLLRYYFPQANGNWDGAIIHSIMAIGIFTNNRPMFNNAVDHFLHGPVNGSIFKYIFPSGQCQESTRDQAHVQLGLGEFAGAAHIAYTQGTDLFSIGGNRLALGYEYTAQFLLGEKPHCYGPISERAKGIRDDYEYVYQHYSSQGVSMPFTKRALDSARVKASVSVLTAARAPGVKNRSKSVQLAVSTIGYPAGARNEPSVKVPGDAIWVDPGKSLQDALNAAAGSNRTVIAKRGVHTLPTTLKIPYGVTLAGEGLETILFLDPSSGVRDAIVNASADMHDVSIRDLVVEGALKTEIPSDPNSVRSFRSSASRGGIMFLGLTQGQMKNITLTHITVRNCTYNGVFISGSTNLKIINCDFTENGSSVVPGPKLQHNLLVTRSSKVEIVDSRMDTSPHGSGIALGHCQDVSVVNCELARNANHGLLVTESSAVTIEGNFVEGNDLSGVMAEYLYKGSENISVQNNIIQYNAGYGVEAYSGKNIRTLNNIYQGNGSNAAQEKLSSERYVIMD